MHVPSGGMYGSGPIIRSPKKSITINSGNFENLRGVNNVNIIYDYSEISVNTYRKESDFLQKKKEVFKDDSVQAEKFTKDWFEARQKYYEPAFETAFNKQGKKLTISGTNYATDNAITLKVTTTYLVANNSKKFAYCPVSVDLECIFLDKNGIELLRYYIKNVPGDDIYDDYGPSEDSFGSAYAEAAKMILKDLKSRWEN